MTTQPIELKGDFRKHPPFLDKFSKNRLISYRAKQLEERYPSLIDTDELKKSLNREITVIDIAKEELKQKVIPLLVRYDHPDGTFEEWRIGEFLFVARG